MKIINVITIHLRKSHETILCLILNVAEVEIVRLEHSVPRVQVSQTHGEMVDNVWHDSARLIVGLTTPRGVFMEVVSSVNLNSSGGTLKSPASISVYDADLDLDHVSRNELVGSTVQLLRYEI